MYGEPRAVRRQATQLREQGVEIQQLADRLVAQAESVPWRGRAAEAMRARIADRAVGLREAAALHATAADTLDRHAHQVDGLQDAIASVERKVDSLVTDARARVAASGSGTGESGTRESGAGPAPEDEVLLAFEPPPTGHRDWLDVELPGL